MKKGKIPVAGSNGIIGFHNEFTPISPCITIGRSGNVGTPYIYEECWAHNTVLYVDDFKGNFPLYLYYLLKTLPLSSFGGGSAVPTLNRNHIHPLVVKHNPNIDVQKRIAFILKSLDDKIELNRRINDNLEQQAQALFKSWLTKCDDYVPISELSLNVTDYSKCNKDKVVLINSSDVTEGKFEHKIYSDNKNLKGHFKKRFQKGDILYSQVRPRNRHWAYCNFDAEDFLASTQLMVIRNRENIIPNILLYQYIIDKNVWLDFTNKTETRSGTFPQGNYEELSSIIVPFGARMEKITSELNCIYSKIYYNLDENSYLTSLRDTLLPHLMSGELKVNDVTI